MENTSQNKMTVSLDNSSSSYGEHFLYKMLEYIYNKLMQDVYN